MQLPDMFICMNNFKTDVRKTGLTLHSLRLQNP